MHETVKEFDEETVGRKKLRHLQRDHSTSLQSVNVKDIGEINHVLVIEEKLKNNKQLDNWKMILCIY